MPSSLIMGTNDEIPYLFLLSAPYNNDTQISFCPQVSHTYQQQSNLPYVIAF